MRREMSSDSKDSDISELSDSDRRKVEGEESSVLIASSVCGTVTSQIKSSGILTALFEFHFWDKMAQPQAHIKSSALIRNISNIEIVYLK